MVQNVGPVNPDRQSERQKAMHVYESTVPKHMNMQEVWTAQWFGLPMFVGKYDKIKKAQLVDKGNTFIRIFVEKLRFHIRKLLMQPDIGSEPTLRHI